MSKIKAVLFDMDGTIMNTIDDLADATNYMLGKYGYPVHSVESYKMMVGNGMRKLVERALPDEHKSEAEVDAALKIFTQYYNEHSMDKTAPYDGVPELVAALKNAGYKTAVVTNKAETSAKPIIEESFPECFDVVIGQRDGMPTKPDPASAHLAMAMLGVQPDECIFIGDSGVDVQTAVNSGAYSVGVLWGFRGEDELRSNGAKSIISRPEQLLDIIGEVE